jgi:hypothetical protein
MAVTILSSDRVKTATNQELLQMAVAASTLFTMITKTTTGDPPSAPSGTICINTYDNSISMYADSGWRVLSTWGSPPGGLTFPLTFPLTF